MPLHDWTRVDAGTWHSFHLSWLGEIKRALNAGLLPPGYYADAERTMRPVVPDVVTLQEAAEEVMDAGGGTATLAPPAATLTQSARVTDETPAPRRLTVRHESGDRLVALIELASPANKDRPASVEQFARKAAGALAEGVHVSIIDPFPPGRTDAPAGLVGAVAVESGLGPLRSPASGWPAGVRMTAAFEADYDDDGQQVRVYAEPLRPGDTLPPLPLFLAPRHYVRVPLAETYAHAWAATPARWRRVLEEGTEGDAEPA